MLYISNLFLLNINIYHYHALIPILLIKYKETNFIIKRTNE